MANSVFKTTKSLSSFSVHVAQIAKLVNVTVCRKSTLTSASRPSDVARPVETKIPKPPYQIKAYKAGYHTIPGILK